MSRSVSSTTRADAASASAIRPERRRAIDRGRLLHATLVSSTLRSAASGVAAVIRVVLGALGGIRRRRSDSYVLLAMSDHMLADIGLTRADAAGMVYGGVRPDRVTSRPEPAPRDNVAVLRPRSHGRRAGEKLDAAA